MTKILGIDTGTNSLGWAIVEKQADNYNLLDKGVNIFQEGVKIEKGIESSKAAERTEHRATRVRYYRIKLRKIRLLRILSDNHLCPPLSQEELSTWRLKKVYPKNELFMQWQRTDDDTEKTPYAYRHKCLHEKLDLSDITDRYILGRAFYHIIQRRGFLSNRKDQSGDDSGKVKEGILATISMLFIIRERKSVNIILHVMNIFFRSLRLYVRSKTWKKNSGWKWYVILKRQYLTKDL